MPEWPVSLRDPILSPPGRLEQAKPDGQESWAGLLDFFYRRQNLSAPPLMRLKGRDVPNPYRELLVHSADMTPTLEAFYERPLGLMVLGRLVRTDAYYREVVLTAGKRPVEYGVIQIHLNHFPESARDEVLREQRPLGGILMGEGIPHVGWPQAFFKLSADSRLQRIFNLKESCCLFGRRNVLLDGSRRLLAEVIEILAPVAGGREGTNYA